MIRTGTWDPLAPRIPVGYKGYNQHGGIAQLGERGLCKPEAGGSIPPTSTITAIVD